jgi:hypothetical protein
MAHYLNANVSNPKHQEILSKLASLYVPSQKNIMLLNWIMAANLPFWVMNSPKFRRWAIYRNPEALLSTNRTMANLLVAKY